jgi:Alkyl sulfatase and related hydrolases
MSTNVFCPVYDDESPLVPPSLTAHSRKMKPGIHQVTERVFLAYGYADANSILLVGDDGVVVVDTTEDEIKARSILAEFRKITDKPIKALIYTHSTRITSVEHGASWTSATWTAGRSKSSPTRPCRISSA